MKMSLINKIIAEALREDAAFGDITTNLLIKKDHVSKAQILIKEEAVICGLEVVKTVFKKLDRKIYFKTSFKDGHKVKKNTVVAVVTGKTRALLSGERVALNFLSHLSGIATTTHRFVEAARPFKAKILDTRKTTPGLRHLEKYAVRCGGGENHRADLSEMVLIKDNHREILGFLTKLQETVRHFKRKTHKPIEVEVDNLNEFEEILKANPDIILLDNMSLQAIKKAVKKRGQRKQPLLEASGGITMKNVHAIAQTGVDRISIGALTHSPLTIDVSMEMI